MADKKETIILDFQVDTTSAVKSIANLTKANKDLREERKNLDLSSKEGKARIVEINDALDENNKTIKENSSALEKQRMNVGNYTTALDRLIPGLSGMTAGIWSTVEAGLAFIATGYGAIIVALGAALAALSAYFKSSEEGQDRWNKIVAVGSAVVEQLKNYVEDTGELIYRVFTEPRKVMAEFIDFVKDGVTKAVLGWKLVLDGIAHGSMEEIKAGFKELKESQEIGLKVITDGWNKFKDSIDAGIESGKKMADLQSKLDKDERKLIVERAKINKDVAELREKAVHEEGDAKRTLINEAIELEKKLADQEVAHAKIKQQLAEEELKNNGDDKDAKLKVAQAIAEVTNQESQRYEATLRFEKQIEALDQAEEKRKDDLAKAEKDRQEQISKDTIAALNKTQAEITKNAATQKKNDEEAAAAKKKVDDATSKSITDNMDAILGTQKINYSAGFALFKKGAITQLTTDTNKAAMASYAALSGIPIVGPVLGAIAYAAAYAKGLSTIAAIAGLNLFSEGGYTGHGSKNQPAGIVHAGEVVWSQADVMAVGGPAIANAMRPSYADGSIVANSMTRGMNGDYGPKIEVNLGLKEFNEFSSRVKLKESITTA